jgi:hypothetical protein
LTKDELTLWALANGWSYAHVVQGSDGEPPRGLGFEKIRSITLLMEQNRNRMVFGRMSGRSGLFALLVVSLVGGKWSRRSWPNRATIG